MSVEIEFSKRFKESVLSAGLAGLNNIELGKVLGVSGPMISYYNNAKRLPSMKQAVGMADKLNVNVDWLLTGNYTKVVGQTSGGTAEALSTISNVKTFPVIKWSEVARWSGSMNNQAVNRQSKQTALPVSGNCFWLEVKSESMNPVFNVGDKVLVDADMTPTNKSYVLVSSGGADYSIKQLIIDGGDLFVKSINPDWPTKLERIEGMKNIKGMIVEKSISFI